MCMRFPVGRREAASRVEDISCLKPKILMEPSKPGSTTGPEIAPWLIPDSLCLKTECNEGKPVILEMPPAVCCSVCLFLTHSGSRFYVSIVRKRLRCHTPNDGPALDSRFRGDRPNTGSRFGVAVYSGSGNRFDNCHSLVTPDELNH